MLAESAVHVTGSWCLVKQTEVQMEEACFFGQFYRGTQAGLSQGLLDMDTVKYGALGSFCKV